MLGSVKKCFKLKQNKIVCSSIIFAQTKQKLKKKNNNISKSEAQYIRQTKNEKNRVAAHKIPLNKIS